ncbi:MAG: hypothetical protein ACREJ0_06990 [Geminicoccaceae bacterium]
MSSSNTVAAGKRGWETKQLVWGCIGSFAAGAIALYFVGFHWVGQWQTGEAVAQKLAVAACVQNFLLQPDRGIVFTELKANTSSYQRRQVIRERNWAADRDVAGLCDDQILGLDPALLEAPETADAESKQPA